MRAPPKYKRHTSGEDQYLALFFELRYNYWTLVNNLLSKQNVIGDFIFQKIQNRGLGVICQKYLRTTGLKY